MAVYICNERFFDDHEGNFVEGTSYELDDVQIAHLQKMGHFGNKKNNIAPHLVSADGTPLPDAEDPEADEESAEEAALDEMSKAQLVDAAVKLKIAGTSKMTRAQLVKAIEAAQE